MLITVTAAREVTIIWKLIGTPLSTRERTMVRSGISRWNSDGLSASTEPRR